MGLSSTDGSSRDGSENAVKMSDLTALPDEILLSVLELLSLADITSLQRTCRHFVHLAESPLIWMRLCQNTYRHWHPRHRFFERLREPASSTPWRQLLRERRLQDASTRELFEAVAVSQQGRIPRIKKIMAHQQDAKDVLESLVECPDDAEDVLARRYWSNEILGGINRDEAIRTLRTALQQPDYPVEKALAAIDHFVIERPPMTIDQVEVYFDSLADEFRKRYPLAQQLSQRQRALVVAEFLIAHNMVGMSPDGPLQRMQNCLITLALCEPEHSSMQLISCTIYCALARRLQINAHISLCPLHIFVIIKDDGSLNLDGEPFDLQHDEWSPQRTMFMDPFANAVEAPVEHVVSIFRMADPRASGFSDYVKANLSPGKMADILRRAAGNLTRSVSAGEHYQTVLTSPCEEFVPASFRPIKETVLNAFRGAYCVWWVQILTIGSGYSRAMQSALQQFADDFTSHYREIDPGLVEEHMLHLFSDPVEKNYVQDLLRYVSEVDSRPKLPKRRSNVDAASGAVRFHIGDVFKHKRFNYTGAITGWDPVCTASSHWMATMQIHTLSRGQHQPFYHIIAQDQSTRYVADDNIRLLAADEFEPSDGLMRIAGRHFKRFDAESCKFVSNIQDQYPDD